MFWRILLESLARRRSRKALACLTVWIGLSLVTALLGLGLDVGDKMNREMRSFGANIKVVPAASSIALSVGGHELAPAAARADLAECDLPNITRTFWRNNILGLVPVLSARCRAGGRSCDFLGVGLDLRIPVEGGEPFVTGAREVYAHWQVSGAWPKSAGECLVGADLARELGIGPGAGIDVAAEAGSARFLVSGVAATGGPEDRAIIAPLAVVQKLAGAAGRLSTIDVSALTTPENKLAEKYRLDPAKLTPAEYERWVCTPYPGSVAAEVQRAIHGSAARVIRRVAEAEGAVLARIDGLMVVLGALTLIACGFGVMGVLSSAVLDRRPEVALLQALGAHRADVLMLFLVEIGLLGLAGGALAALTGSLAGRWLVEEVFGSAADVHLSLAILSPFLGLILALAAGAWPVWQALHQKPAQVLQGNSGGSRQVTMLARMVRSSLSRNAKVSMWTLAALASCAVLVTIFVHLSLELGERMQGALRQVGANAVAYPASPDGRSSVTGGPSINWQALSEQASRSGARHLVLEMRVGLLSGKPVAVVWDPSGRLEEMTGYWSVTGRRPAAPGEALAGKRAAEALGLAIDQYAEVAWAEPPGKERLRVVGVFECGDEDEDRLFLAAPAASPGPASPPVGAGPGRAYALLSVPGGLRDVERLAGAVAAAEPGIQIRPLRQILHGEEVILEKIRLLSGLALAVVVILTSLGVSASTLARVLERRKELALLQALGAERRKVVVFLLAESATLGVAASAVGFVLGAVLTFILVKSIFHLAVFPSLSALPAAVAVTTAVALAASLLAARRALRLQPSAALRGE